MINLKNSIDDICLNTKKMLNDLQNGTYDNEQEFGKYSPCYKFSNELLSIYMSLFDFNNKSVLTVCGSGDQAISSLLMGAKDIDIFDSNLLTYFNMWLKIYAIKNLPFENFCSFYDNRNLNKKKLYTQVLHNVKNDISTFWDYIFSLDDDMLKYFFRFCFSIDEYMFLIPYLKKESYEKLRLLLNENPFDYKKGLIGGSQIRFKSCDLFNLNSYCKGKSYDFINFSNIYDYIPYNQLNYFYHLCKYMVDENLDNNGNILLNYCWDTTDIKNLIKNLNAEIINLGSFNDYDNSVAIYTKKVH